MYLHVGGTEPGGGVSVEATDVSPLNMEFSKSLCDSKFIVSLLQMGRKKWNDSKSPTRKDSLIFL